MKTNFSHIGLAKLCGWFGITRQTYCQNSRMAVKVSIEEALIKKKVKRIRKLHELIGTGKLYELNVLHKSIYRVCVSWNLLPFPVYGNNNITIRNRARYRIR